MLSSTATATGGDPKGPRVTQARRPSSSRRDASSFVGATKGVACTVCQPDWGLGTSSDSGTSDNVAFPLVTCLPVAWLSPTGVPSHLHGSRHDTSHDCVSLGLIPGQWAGIKSGHEAGMRLTLFAGRFGFLAHAGREAGPAASNLASRCGASQPVCSVADVRWCAVSQVDWLQAQRGR